MNVVRFCERNKTQVSKMLPINQIILHFIEWTDHRRLVNQQGQNLRYLHYEMAQMIASFILENHTGINIF